MNDEMKTESGQVSDNPVPAPVLSRDEWFLRAYGHSDRQPLTFRSAVRSVGRWFPGTRVLLSAGFGVLLGGGFAASRLAPRDAGQAQLTVEQVASSPASSAVAISHATLLPTAPPSAPAPTDNALSVRDNALATRAHFQASSSSFSQTSLRTPSEPAPDEVGRLKARNRRLEALIFVLRQRKQEQKSAPEPSTYIGQ